MRRVHPSLQARGLLVAGLQGLLLLSLAAQLFLERLTRPRGWALTEPVDPDLPIRGRYLSLRLVVPAPDLPSRHRASVRLLQRGGRIVAIPGSAWTGGGTDPEATVPLQASIERRGSTTVALPSEPLAFFLPDEAGDPSTGRQAGPLWVEVTLPRRGAPRPIRLGMEQDGRIVPLSRRGAPPGTPAEGEP